MTRTLTIIDALRDGSEVPTAQRLAKASSTRVTEDQERSRAVWVGDDSPIGQMAFRKLLTPRQYEAGQIFRGHYYQANGSGVRAVNLEASVSGGDKNFTDRQIAAKQVLKLARVRLGEALYMTLEAVCGIGENAGRFATDNGLHPVIGSDRLRIALDLYADDRGLPKD